MLLHADADAFFAAVEQRDDPRLRGRPVIVGEGVVMAASYEARAYGVRGGMGGGRARRLCPEAVVVPPRFTAYVAASRALFELFDATAPRVERMSMEEAFLDVRGLGPSPRAVAVRLRRAARDRVGLAVTVGVARTTVLAKVASRRAKPDGLLVVAPERERAFLHPLPIERLWGVGPAGAARLHARGVATVGDAARLGEDALVAILGRAAGRYVHAAANGREPRPLVVRRGRRSFGSQHALAQPARSVEALDAALAAIVDRVARRMRAAGRAGRTVALHLRWSDFTRVSRSRTLARPTAATRPLLAAARELLAAARALVERRGVTLVGVAVAGLVHDAAQLALPLPGADGRALDDAVDGVRDRFGPDALTRAARLGDDPRLAPWLMPGDVPR